MKGFWRRFEFSNKGVYRDIRLFGKVEDARKTEKIYQVIFLSLQRFLICFILGISTLASYSQEYWEKYFMSFFLPSVYGDTISTQVLLSVYGDDTDKIYLRMYPLLVYNAPGYKEYHAYTIPKGNHIYLKLDNDEIIDLICSKDESLRDGYLTTKNDITQKYKDYSYFEIDSSIINKLLNHDIIKVRGQFCIKVEDGSIKCESDKELPETKSRFKESYDYVLQKQAEAKSAKDRDQKLKEDPLYGF